MDQSFTLEIVAKPAHIHPNPKTSVTADVRSTIRGAIPVELGVFPKVAPTVQACPKRAEFSAPNSRGLALLDENQQLHNPFESLTPRHDAAQATTGPQRLVVTRSDEVPQTKCDTKSKQISSITVKNEGRLEIVVKVEQKPVESTSVSGHDKPTLHENFMHFSPKSKLKAIKQFLETFEYKRTAGTHFNPHKIRPLARIMDIARMGLCPKIFVVVNGDLASEHDRPIEHFRVISTLRLQTIIYSPQPIKCVEAVFLALYLTASITECDRIPLSFKTSCRGQVYQHIVLLVRYGGRFGAFGISRNLDLMTKDIKFSCIRDIVEDYKKSYEEAEHLVLKIRVGLQVEHEVNSPNFVCWRHLSVNPIVQPWEKCCEALESHLMKQRKLWNKWLLLGKGSDPRRKCQERKAPLDNKLVRNIAELNKNVNSEGDVPSTTVKADSLEHKEVEERTHYNREHFSEVLAEAKKENRHDSRNLHARSKPSVKVHVFKSQASSFLRRSVQFVHPNFFSGKSFLKCGSPLEPR